MEKRRQIKRSSNLESKDDKDTTFETEDTKSSTKKKQESEQVKKTQYSEVGKRISDSVQKTMKVTIKIGEAEYERFEKFMSS
jgi:hypothetical protein